MGGLSIWHWLIVIAVALLLFGGRGRVSAMMGDLGKGIKSFKQSMAEEEGGKGTPDAKMDEPGVLNPPPAAPVSEQTKTPVNNG